MCNLTPMTPSQLASANVRAEMGRQRVSQAELVRRLGVNVMWLSRRLNDRVPLTVDDLVRIAAALNVPATSLSDLGDAA